MKKRVCLLTGASGYFGTAFIQRYHEEYDIFAVYHEGPVRFATQDQLLVDPLSPALPVPANHHPVQAIQADLANESDIERVVDFISRRGVVVDLLINAAAQRRWARLEDPSTSHSAEHLMRLNVLAPLRLSLALLRAMWSADAALNSKHKRNIINLSSTAGLFVYEDLGQALYAASKAALNHLTYHMASEFWDHGVRVNGVAPDSFPGRVPLEDVLDTVIGLDRSEATGTVVPLHAKAAVTPPAHGRGISKQPARRKRTQTDAP